MIITNKLNMPEAYVKAIQNSRHNADKCLSATTLLKGTKEIILTDRHFDEIEVDVYLEDIPECFKDMLPITKEIKNTVDEIKAYDLFIALDCGDMSRLGFSSVLFEQAKATFCVDHHISNQGCGDVNYIVPSASSACELVFDLISYDRITKEIAECLYTGMVHDTGVFQYSSTAPETMEAAADLMRRNIRANEMIDKTFYEKTYAQNKILGKALEESYLLSEGKIIVSCITKEMMNDYGVIPKDLEGIVSQLRVTKGVEVAIFLYQTGEEEYKVSLRASGDVDVSKVAEAFDGGGHKKAAGVSIKGNAKEIIAQITEHIQAQL